MPIVDEDRWTVMVCTLRFDKVWTELTTFDATHVLELFMDDADLTELHVMRERHRHTERGKV